MADGVVTGRRAVGVVLLLAVLHAALGAVDEVSPTQTSLTSLTSSSVTLTSSSPTSTKPQTIVTPTPSREEPSAVVEVKTTQTTMTSSPVILTSSSPTSTKPQTIVTPTPSSGVPGTSEPRPSRPGDSREEGSLPVAAYVAMGGGGVGFLAILVTGFCLWVRCKRDGMKRKLRKNISASSVATWGAPSTVSTYYQRETSEQAMDWRRHPKARNAEVDSAIEMGSVVTGLTHSPSTLISPDDSVSQVLRPQSTGLGACKERQKLMELLKQKIREKPQLEAQIINIPESFYENRRNFPKDRQKRIEDVLECFSTDTLVQTLHDINKQ